MSATNEVLSAHYVSEYPYRRSLGPVLGRFFAGLRDRRLFGVRAADGKVIVPPAEYDPRSGESLDELVEVGPEGTIETWTWIAAPRPRHPLPRPFAFALVRLDGADVPLLHAVDAGAPEAMRRGVRVRPRWAEARSGSIRDLACFEIAEGAAVAREPGPPPSEIAPIGTIKIPLRLDYEVIAGRATTRFLRGLAEGRLIGQRCPGCTKVYLPPRGSCPTCGVPTEEEVPLGDHGVVSTFCIVNVPSESLTIPIPYVAASIKIDGADTAIFHLVRDIPVEEVRMGLRVRAVWMPHEEWRPTLSSIAHFAPTGEPDAAWDAYKGAL